MDLTTYTMDQYVTGVLKAEVGPTAEIASWHLEALKAVTVASRTYAWHRAVFISESTYELDSTGQAFFPEKSVDNEQKYQNAAALTSGHYLSHPDGSGAAQVINALHFLDHGQSSLAPTPRPICDFFFKECYNGGVLSQGGLQW